MNFLEKTLDSKINPLVMLGKTGTMAVTGFLNKFNADGTPILYLGGQVT